MADAAMELETTERALVVRVGEVDVATYVFWPDAPAEEAPKPYFHPLRTLAGAPVSVYRPWDHRWHKGLQMTWSHLSGQNFWGGPTFERGAPGNGYVWRDNLGREQHERFDKVVATGDAVEVAEQLTWITSTGHTWLHEQRSFRCHGADPRGGVWVLDFATTLANVSGRPLDFGSPTTHGRDDAGYTGLFWRGPRSWTGGRLVGADDTGGEGLMGRQAEWVAFCGENDEVDGSAAVLVYAGHSSAPVPLTWFARSSQFAALNPSPAFHAGFTLEPGETLDLRHRLLFLDGHALRAELERTAHHHRP